MNEKFFRQPQAVEIGGSNVEIDKSIDRFFKSFCKALVEEANSGPRKRALEDYIEHYGKEHKGFLNYAEFSSIFRTHALPIMLPKGPPPEEGKLLALFSIFDAQSRGRVALNDFVQTVARSLPNISLVERLGNKVRKGGERMVKALKEEFLEADAPFGCNGRLPLGSF